MEPIYRNTELTINNLIEDIDSGALGLPELQRPFIWNNKQVKNLFDSLLRGYPIGYLMLWDCPEFRKTKSIGTTMHSYDSPRQVIIDGQQRLTSLYAVMKGKKVINSQYAEKAIIISYKPLDDDSPYGLFETKNGKGSPEWIYNISDIFTTKNLHRYIEDFNSNLSNYYNSKDMELTEEQKDIISDNISAVSNLKTIMMRIIEINADTDEEDVAEIFVRVNSKGVTLKQNDFILTLLSVYWDEGRKEIEQFCIESRTPQKGRVTSYNLITEVSAQDIIRVVLAYGFNRARLKYGYKLLRGADFDKKGAVSEELRDQRFSVLKQKLPDVLNLNSWKEFLKAVMNAGYLSGEVVSSENALFYTYAMYLIAKHRFHASETQNMHLTSLWIFYALLVSLYTGSFESTFEQQLNIIKNLSTVQEYREFIISRVQESLTNDFFEITFVGSTGLAVSGKPTNAWNAYVASLNILNSTVLFSKSNLLLSKLFEPEIDGTRKSLERHHLFPVAYLRSIGYTDNKINQMANYAYIDWKDNMEILDDAPEIYYPIICEGRAQEEIEKMENDNALPHGWEHMDYDEFLITRRKLMSEKVKQAYEILLKNVTQ